MDLNADLAERSDVAGWAADRQLLELVTTASVACGGHAGDEETMRRACAQAAELGVRVGAHPGYPDRAGFGRVELGLPADEVLEHFASQLAGLQEIAGAEGAVLTHVKPHGALYHRAATDQELAAGLAGLVATTDGSLAVLTQPGSLLAEEAGSLGLATAAEAFADRAYAADGRLLDRSAEGAVLDRGSAVNQAVMIARDGVVTGAGGQPVAVRADSICLHGDGPGAVELARAVREALIAEGLEVRPFA